MTETADIDSMPRAGFGAPVWDRKLQTDRLEYLDRDDVPAKKRSVVESLDLLGEKKGLHRWNAEQAAGFLVGIDSPRVLELGAAHGGLSRELLKLRPDASITVTDIEPSSVAGIAASGMGSISGERPCHGRDGYRCAGRGVRSGGVRLVVPPSPTVACREGVRRGHPGGAHSVDHRSVALAGSAAGARVPFAAAVGWVRPVAHDGAISQLRAYGPRALRSLAEHADPSIIIELRARLQLPMPLQIVVARRGL